MSELLNENVAGRKILLVDDSQTALKLVAQVMEEGGFQVFTAGSGEDGLRQYQACQPDLVVLDILMPGMDGLEVCRRIRALEGERRVPILFLTGDLRPHTQLLAIEAGGDDLIHKPSLHSELLIRMRSLLRIQDLQRDLRQERDVLKTIQEQKDHLFHFIIHDLKGPLQVLHSTIELLSFKNLGDDSRAYLGRLAETSTAMAHMIQDLLDVTRSSRAGLNVSMAELPLGTLSTLWVRDLSVLATRKAQTLVNEIPPDMVVLGDEDLLGRCVFNLLSNACKYGPEGGQVRLRVSTQGSRVRLMVEDQGPGVPVELRDRIFEPFFRLERDSGMARQSSGLGLAFCRMAAKALNGHIWVDAMEPVGSRFCMEWQGAVLENRAMGGVG